MPRIPTYEQQTTASGTLSVRTVDTGGEDLIRGGAMLAGAARETSRNARYVQEVDRRKKIADDVSSAHLAATKASAHWTQHLFERQQQADADPTGFTDGLLTDFDKYGTELVATAQTAEGKAYLTGEVAQLRGQLVSRSLPWEAERGITRRADQYSQSVDQQRIALRADPSLFDKVIEQQSVAINAASLPTAVRDKLWAQTRQSIAESAVATLIQRDPAGTLKALRTGPGQSGSSIIEGLSADDRDRAMGAAQSEIHRREAEARARSVEARQALSEAEADALAAKSVGMPAQMPSRAQYVAAFGATEGNKRYTQKTQLFGVYDAINAAVLMPPTEAAAAIAAYRPTQQAGAADQLDVARAAVGLYEQSRKAFEADPAGTLIGRDPQLRAAYEAATAPGATPQAVQQYAAKVRSIQSAAGIGAPKILPAAQAEAIAAQLTFDPKQPQKRAQQFQLLEQTWGRSYSQILREVAPKMDGTARVMVGMQPEKAARLDAAIAAGEQAGKSVPQANQKAVNDELEALLAPFAATLSDNVDFDQRYGEHYEAARSLALSAVARGESPRVAARNAVQAVVGDTYQVHGRVRIPQGMAAEPVLAGAEWARREALKQPLRIEASSYSDDAQAQADLKETIARDGYWVTNDDHTGLLLRVPTRRGNSTVYRADGTPYTLTWAELDQMAAQGTQVRSEAALDLTRRGGMGGPK